MDSLITVPLNIVRILLTCMWTIIVGTPLWVFISARYWYGRSRAVLGRPAIFDRILEANAVLAGWVAQRLWATVILALAGVRLRVRETAPVDWSTAHVVCANHASIFDVLAMVATIPPPFRFVAKREVLKWPIIGWALRPAAQIVVDRSDRVQAVRSLGEAGHRHISGQVIFFVEGTRTLTGRLLPFKKGAFHFAIDNRLPILPAAVIGSYAALAKSPWWRLRPGREIEVVFCQPVHPSSALDHDERAQVEALLEATHAHIVGVLTGAAEGRIAKPRNSGLSA